MTIEQTMEQVVSAAQAIPRKRDLTIIIEDSVRAAERSYYLPDEDERLRLVFSSYLRTRSILIEALESIMPILKNKLHWHHELRTFTLGLTAACLLVRSTKFIIETAKQHPVIWKKLDESELRYGIERKSISKLYESLSSRKKMRPFHHATRFYETAKKDILALANASDLDKELIQLLEQETPYIESRKRDHLSLRIRYRFYDIVRRNSSGYKKAMFHIFRLTGSVVAELKQPLKKTNTYAKRVTEKNLTEIQSKLTPGDIIITRHDDALSNLFLPGFWPHAAFYMGNDAALAKLGSFKLPDFYPSGTEIIESKKDGVKFRTINETFDVDSFVILRPTLNSKSLAQAIQNAISHAGKRYDFLFDFTQANRLACTELIYRAYHGIDDLKFTLNERSGRKCISAEDLIDQMIQSGKFEPFALYTENSCGIIYHSEAKKALKESYCANW